MVDQWTITMVKVVGWLYPMLRAGPRFQPPIHSSSRFAAIQVTIPGAVVSVVAAAVSATAGCGDALNNGPPASRGVMACEWNQLTRLVELLGCSPTTLLLAG